MSETKRHLRTKKHFKILKNNKGATLIELLISLALLALITTVFIQIINSSLSLRMRSDLEKEASAIAMNTVETLKLADEVPAENHTLVTTNDGYTVETTLIEVTDAMGLSTADLGLAQDQNFDNPDLSFSVNETLDVLKSNGVLSSSALTGLVDQTITFSVLTIGGSIDTHQYVLSFTNNLGLQTINLGNFTRVNNVRKTIRINVGAALSQNILWQFEDQTGEPLHVGIYDNLNQRLQVNTSAVGTDVLVTDGYLNEGESNALQDKYYEVTVVVSRNGDEYARILTTWAVKGD